MLSPRIKSWLKALAAIILLIPVLVAGAHFWNSRQEHAISDRLIELGCKVEHVPYSSPVFGYRIWKLMSPTVELVAITSNGSAALAELHRLRGLRQLALTDISLDSPPPIFERSGKLKSLALHNVHGLDVPQVLIRQPHLESLDIWEAELPDLACLNELTKLRHLGLFNVNSSDFGPIGSVTGIRTLSLINCSMKSLEFLRTMQELRWLGIVSAESNDLEPLSELDSVFELVLHVPRAPDYAALASMDQLRHVSIRCDSPDELRGKDLERLQQVDSLSIYVPDVDDAGFNKPLQQLARRLPKCRLTVQSQESWIGSRSRSKEPVNGPTPNGG